MTGPKIVEDARNERFSSVLNDIAQMDRPSGADLMFRVATSQLTWNGTQYKRGDTIAINGNHPRLEAMLTMGHFVPDLTGNQPLNR